MLEYQRLALFWSMALLWGTAALSQGTAAPAPLPSAVRCTAMFAITLEALERKSGDPAMTKAFREDTAALRRIVITETRQADAEVVADSAISREIAVLHGEMHARNVDETSLDLKSCYRVKALGPRGE